MSRVPKLLCVMLPAVVQLAAPAVARADDTETILFVRHGEKPEAGLGQLSCKGLNRALALPARLERLFGKIDAVVAPNPAQQKEDGSASYDYVRPVATAEPTAIRFGLPINASIGYAESARLLKALNDPTYRNAKVLVVWEHHALRRLVPQLVSSLGGDEKLLPDWASNDFDSIWRITITRAGGQAKVAFAHEHEGLDGQPDACPG